MECPQTLPIVGEYSPSEDWSPYACPFQLFVVLLILRSGLIITYDQEKMSSIVGNHIIRTTYSPYFVALLPYLMAKDDFSSLETQEIELIFPSEAPYPPLPHLLTHFYSLGCVFLRSI